MGVSVLHLPVLLWVLPLPVLLHQVRGEGALLSAEAVRSLAVRWGLKAETPNGVPGRRGVFASAWGFSPRFPLPVANFSLLPAGGRASMTEDVDSSSPRTVGEKADPRRG